MKRLLLLSVFFASLLASAQDNPWRVVGNGVVGFIQTDSVWVGKVPDEKKLHQATNAAELWPEMTGAQVFGAIVWPCLSDSAGWYKVRAISFDQKAEDSELGTAVAYVKHSPFVEYQTWETYLKGKYLYDVPATTKFFKNKEDKTPLVCSQRGCLQITEVSGNWVKVITPTQGCDAAQKTCIEEAWLVWTDGKGKLLVPLKP